LNFPQIRARDLGNAHHHRAGGEIAQALLVAAENTSDSAHQVQERQTVDETHEVPNHHLAGLQAHSPRIHNPQCHQSFTDGLAVPQPFRERAVNQINHEKQDHLDALGNILSEDLEGCQDLI
jgi:hypothetical protein